MIDLLFYIIVVLAIIQGWRKGLLMAFFSLLCTLVGLAAAIKLSAVVAERFAREPGVPVKWLPVLSFIAVFLIVVLLVRGVGKLLESALRLVLLGWLNRLGGVLLYIILFISVYSICLYYGNGMHLIPPQAIATSRYYPSVSAWGPRVVEGIARIIPFGKDMFAALESFFERTERQLR